MSRKRHSRDLSVNEKLFAVKRIQAGESKASVARNINVPESTLRGWCKNSEKLFQKLTEHTINVSLTAPPQVPQMSLNFASNERAKHGDEISKSRSVSDVIDLTSADKAKSLHRTPQYYDESQANWSTGLSMGSTLESNSRSNHFALPGPNDLQPKGLYTPYVDAMFNYPRDERHFFPNNKLVITSPNSYPPTTPTSPVLTSFPSNGSSPSLPIPTTSSTAQMFPPTTPTLHDAKESILLWQAHHINQSLIERMADKSPTDSKINFNNNIYTPHDLSVLRSPSKVEQVASLSTPLPSSSPQYQSKPSVIVDERQDALTNLNNNHIAVNKDSAADIAGLQDAIKYAEKFSQWFDTYSDPTITTQDVMRFEKLLGKVKKIFERKHMHKTVPSGKICRRK